MARRWSTSGPTSMLMPMTMIPVANTPTGIAPITGAPTASASAEAPATITPFAGPFMPRPVASSVSASEW